MQFLTFWNLPQFPSPRWTRHQQPHANAASSNPCPAGTECLLLSTRPRPGGRLTKRAGVRRRFPASESVASAVFLQNQGFDRLQLLSPDFPASREHAPRRGSSSRVAPISLVPCGLLATWAGRRLIAVFTQERPAPCRGVETGPCDFPRSAAVSFDVDPSSSLGQERGTMASSRTLLVALVWHVVCCRCKMAMCPVSFSSPPGDFPCFVRPVCSRITGLSRC